MVLFMFTSHSRVHLFSSLSSSNKRSVRLKIRLLNGNILPRANILRKGIDGEVLLNE